LSAFATRLIRWQRRHGRHDLPWQKTRDPYRIWLSEVMLQQTQVATVVPYFRRFLARFPDVASLARAPLEEVLRLWSGLGYYSRARNLHAAAARLVESHLGRFPRRREAIETLPGVGRSTAAAIAVFAFGAREAILDGNVKRVLARHFAVRGYPGEKPTENRLWRIAESLLPPKNIRSYTQALMDLGATLCTRSRPACGECPLKKSCRARAGGKTDAYPQPRPRKALPVRTTSILLLLHEGDVLLEKRPPAGIWGGLWCLPEIPRGEDPGDYCARRWGTQVARVTRLPPVRHGFTHFILNIRPVVCRASPASSLVSEPGQVSLPPEEAVQAAVPAPVKRLLAELRARKNQSF
jgi:A/G-specific adenine glycosylase